MQSYRLRHAFRKDCAESLHATLRFALGVRHLDFICDMCGTTNFLGPRLKCRVCDNFDLCYKCHHSTDPLTHRYLFREGKWSLERNFHTHTSAHATDLVLPPFYDHARWEESGGGAVLRSASLRRQPAQSARLQDSPHFD